MEANLCKTTIEGGSCSSSKPKYITQLETNDSRLTRLDFVFKKIRGGSEGTKSLANALCNNTTLKVLWLDGNNIGIDGAKALSLALGKNKTLRELGLINDNLGDEGAKALAECIHGCLPLVRLVLTDNGISDHGAKAMAKMLYKNTALKRLGLNFNNIGNEGGLALANALRENTTLKELEISHRNYGISQETRDHIKLMLNINQNSETSDEVKIEQKMLYSLEDCPNSRERETFRIRSDTDVKQRLKEMQSFNACSPTKPGFTPKFFSKFSARCFSQQKIILSNASVDSLQKSNSGVEPVSQCSLSLPSTSQIKHDGNELNTSNDHGPRRFNGLEEKVEVNELNGQGQDKTNLLEKSNGTSGTKPNLFPANSNVATTFPNHPATMQSFKRTTSRNSSSYSESPIYSKTSDLLSSKEMSHIYHISDFGTPFPVGTDAIDKGEKSLSLSHHKKITDDNSLNVENSQANTISINQIYRNPQTATNEENTADSSFHFEDPIPQKFNHEMDEVCPPSEKYDTMSNEIFLQPKQDLDGEESKGVLFSDKENAKSSLKVRKTTKVSNSRKHDIAMNVETPPCEGRQEAQDNVFPQSIRQDEKSSSNALVTNDKEFNRIRKKLVFSIKHKRMKPIQLPLEYVKLIKTNNQVGGGFFGDVYKGLDEVTGQEFAVKVINPLILENDFTSRLNEVQKSFQNEIEVLSKLKHPNIAPLYGYHISSQGIKNATLLYELAPNGSLDKFWEDELGRERLSEGEVRARIAFEVATAIRYMHEGLDGNAVCYHRDIKSANICLTADFSPRVIDCGISKYVTEIDGSFSSAGPSGTPGYMCPQYSQGEIDFESACDVFSFGVFLCDLITGKTCGRRAQHYPVYGRDKDRCLETDADEFVDWGDGNILATLVKMALACMRMKASSRPSIATVVHELQKALDRDEKTYSAGEAHAEQKDESNRCRVCGELCTKWIKCNGSKNQHIHCSRCVEKQLIKDINSSKYNFTCLKEDCDSRPFNEDEMIGLISQNAWISYQTQKMGALMMNRFLQGLIGMHSHIENVQSLQAKLCAGNGLPCPSLFILLEADRPTSAWRHPREWAKNTKSVKLYLYFVCSHSLQTVSENCRIKLRYCHAWLKRVAPALNLTIDLIKGATSIAFGPGSHIDLPKLNEMDEWAKELLDPDQKDLFRAAKRSNGRLSKPLQTLVGQSLSLVAEKAASSNVNWQSELGPVYDYKSGEPTFVKHEYALDSRYKWDMLSVRNKFNHVAHI